MKINKDLTAAAALPLILTLLSRNESYGYDLIRTVKDLSERNWEWTEGMLYPILHRLEKQGWAESFWKNTPAGRRRKYYSITAAGKEALEDLNRQWNLVGATLERAAGGKEGKDE